MATYYSSPGNERESHDMYSRDPGGAPYQMSSALGNLLYLNNQSPGPYTEFSGILQSQQNCMEMPGHGHHHSAMSHDSSARESDMLGHSSFGHVKDMKNEMLMHMMDGAQHSGGAELIHDGDHNGAQFEFGVLNNHHGSPNVPSGQGQGLSLSLNTQILAPSLPYWSIKPDMLTPSSYHESLRVDEIRMKSMQSEASRAIRHSRYLKAAQEVLDEVVNVWKSIKQKAQKEQVEPGKTEGKETDGGPKSEGSNPQESGANAPPELSTAEKQELQNKMAKLMAMLDEVDRKYKHYYHQMQNVVSSFDVVAGPGSAKPYTAVALQTISRHFRCLKDAINDQINVIRKKLGEEENSSGKEGKLTRLRYIDQQLRQQRAFQQYGMIPQNAWRPQRGLPENSVTVLRAWLFEHFLHPYPKDSEKLMLARQTGLTRSQISNWFINARVRLWKPMIEDMYKEETGDLEQDSNSSSDNNVPRSKNKVASSEENEDLKSARARVCETSQLSESRASIGTMNVGGAPVGFHNEANQDDSFMNLMMKEQRSGGQVDGGLLLHNAVAQQSDENARFMAYHLAELGRYGNGNVSLTLGLQHPGSGLSVPNAQVNFPGVGDDDIYNAGAPLGVSIASSDYESMNQIDQRQRFEQSPLLHDFVA